MTKKIRPIAIYLPQFHPIPENDEWWGKGFTEWTNVVKAKPKFSGHYQPHLPADLGFYDLRLPEVREAQANLARQYGVYGFCYYHYWFNGRRVLERPFQEVFESGKPDFPFMLCWANENWTRRWDGGDERVLLKQEYHEADDVKHIHTLIPYFKDERYIKVNGKPVFIIYKDKLIPNLDRTLNTFRSECQKAGIELYLCRFERHLGTHPGDPVSLGFDAGAEFQPFAPALSQFIKKQKVNPWPKYLRAQKYKDFLYYKVLKRQPKKDDIVVDYSKFVDFDINNEPEKRKIFPGVCPAWDNTSRRVSSYAQIFVNSTPDVFGRWVRSKVERFKPFSPEENFLFINAWNEWAEGNHLEPCQKWGHEYLLALKKNIES